MHFHQLHSWVAENSGVLIGLVGSTVVASSTWYGHRRLNDQAHHDLDAANFFLLPKSIEIHIIDDEKQCEELISSWCDSLKQLITGKTEELMYDQSNISEDQLVIGLDCEWRTKKLGHERVGLLQLCDGKVCYLIRVFKFESLPPSLVDLLENPNVLKVGVGISNDIRALFRDFQVQMQGCIDLQTIAHKFNYIEGGTGLSNLCNKFLGISLNKTHTVRCSDWERPKLRQRQIGYAATDAWAGHKIFLTIYQKHNDQNLTVLEWGSEFVDRRPIVIKTKTPGSPQPIREKMLRTAARKKPLYDNCKMLSPDGDLLCGISEKKARWYLDRDLADIVETDPIVIKLRFRPAGNGHAGDDYYLADKSNKCVVCGDEKEVVRHYVVPYSYRKHMDLRIKSSSSHDIVLLCKKCMQKAGVVDGQFKSQIAREYQAPVEGIGEKYLLNREVAKYKSKAAALIREANKLPFSRIQELQSELRDYLSKEELKEDDLQQLAAMETKVLNPDYKSHEQVVIENITSDEELLQFVKKWRSHFVRSMNPQHLPSHWSIDHSI